MNIYKEKICLSINIQKFPKKLVERTKAIKRIINCLPQITDYTDLRQ